MKVSTIAYSSQAPVILQDGAQRIAKKYGVLVEPKSENETVQRLSEAFRREGLKLPEIRKVPHI